MALFSDLRRHCQRLAETCCVGDEMIGGEHRHDRFRVLPAQVDRPQPDARSRATTIWLDDEILRWQFRRLRDQCLHVFSARDDENLLRLEKGRNSVHRVLEHGALTDQPERLLGTIATAERP